MRWSAKPGPTWQEREAALKVWHRWFAWHPVCVFKALDGKEHWVWLEFVERKGTLHHGYEEYRWEWAYQPGAQ